MNLAEKEYKSRKKYKTKQKEIQPEWFNKEIEVQKPNEENRKKMQDLLKEFK